MIKDERRAGTTRRSVPDPEPLFQWAKRTDGVSADALVTWGARLLPPLTISDDDLDEGLGLLDEALAAGLGG